MSGSTSVPQPVFGDNGFVMPVESDILAGVQLDMNAAFGGNMNLDLSTPQGQLATSETAIIGDANAQLAWFFNQVDPQYASGRMQDAIGRIYFLTRIPATSTVVTARCYGLTGAIIPIGALALSDDGNLYTCTGAGTIPAGGYVDIPFTCAATGPIACPAGSLNTIYQSILGWDSIGNLADGVMGNAVESRAAFEARRSASVSKNSVGSLSAIQGAVLEVAGVLDAYTYENYTSSPVVVGGKTLLAKSVYVCVSGGVDADVAKALWTKKAPGCGYTGNTTIVVTDYNSGYNVPYPTYNVTFQRPTSITVVFEVQIVNSTTVPANAGALVQAAILNAFAGADGGTRARIGSTLFASRYYASVASLGAWAQIIFLQIGRQAAAATYTASTAGTVMTVSAISTGTLAPGQLITGTGVAAGTFIVSQATGSTGSTGTYNISVSQTLGGRTMYSTNMVNTMQMNIDEVPVCAAVNINVVLV